VGHELVTAHMVFDMQPDFRKKGRLVARGHFTDPLASILYSSVISRKPVQIEFLLAVLNGLDVMSDDIGNAYLTARTGKEVLSTCGQALVDPCISRKAVIISALQGLNSSGADMRSCLAEELCDKSSYGSCQANYDVWFRSAQRPDDGKYYKYVLAHTDDIFMFVMHSNSNIQSS
jgi:hypothetical protein